ncbi:MULTISPECIES: Rv2175c family DNA-binding protein [Nonomuraea]|uniref:Rv2175c family DNA-binding protein n=2 Tax=Nonomuraea TaxID=83681 RepID=A0ABW1BSW6_9ACTN|nr:MULTISPECIES: Rv2175c family DNA-binding protein [Nonomuraea]MDA0639959.1 Rv2175c family DNA-binding protein [Nonomuraea ferruginea]TXK41948.1 DNA-binding protein [Nonomuraea sp. C10]
MTLSVAQIDRETDALVDEWLTLPEVADRMGLTMGRAKQLLKDHKLLGVRRGSGGPQVPAVFLDGRDVMKGLPGTLTVLQDAGYDDVESLRWLFTPDDSLPGSPVEAIRAGRHTEVKRRAQALAF